MGYDVLDIRSTPNPDAKKFILDREISDRPVSFLSAASAAGDELASQMFAVEGVTSVLLLGDFVTINKAPGGKWPTITRQVREILKKFDMPSR